jgi:putative acetyltransferase
LTEKEPDTDQIVVRHVEPADIEALHRIFTGPRAIAGTLGLPLRSVEEVRRRYSDPPEGTHSLVACVDGEVVGELSLWTRTNPRVRHSASFGMAVRDDWQGKGVGTALLRAALDLADNWLGLTRIELHVYTDNAAGTSFRLSEISSPGSCKSPQNAPLTSGVLSSLTTTRSLSIL